MNKMPPVVAIAEKDFSPETLQLRYAPVSRRLQQLGCRTVALDGITHHVQDGVFGRYYDLSDGSMEAVDQSITVHAARDLTGGLARYTPVACLNPRGLRGLVTSKAATYGALSPYMPDVLPLTMLARPDIASVSTVLENFAPDSTLVLKPEKGRASKKVFIDKRSKLIELLPEIVQAYIPADGGVLVQEYMPETSAHFHASIQPLSANEEAVIGEGVNREVRVHVIDGEPFLVHGKVSLGTAQAKNEYVFFDPASVPSIVVETASRAATLLQSTAEVTDAYLAIDLTPDGSRIMEVNGRNQAAITPDRPEALDAHERWVRAIASKLADMALRQVRRDDNA